MISSSFSYPTGYRQTKKNSQATIHSPKTYTSTAILFLLIFCLIYPLQSNIFANTPAVNAMFLDGENTQAYGVTSSVSFFASRSDIASYTSPLMEYTVTANDTVDRVAQKFGTTADRVTMINDLQSPELVIGQRLYVANQDGYVYTMKDSVSAKVFATMYGLPLEGLMQNNGLVDQNQKINAGTAIFIPLSKAKLIAAGLIAKPLPVVVAQTTTKKQSLAVIDTKTKKTIAAKPVVKKTVAMGRPTVSDVSEKLDKNHTIEGKPTVGIVKSRRKRQSTIAGFAGGYCTAYAAAKAQWLFPVFNSVGSRYRSIQGNAKDRRSSAKANGFTRSPKPTIGSVMVVGSSSQSSLGHVAIVEEIDFDSNMIKVSDMNYVGANIISIRWIQMNDAMTQATAGSAPILGFIPVQTLPDQVQKEYNEARKG